MNDQSSVAAPGEDLLSDFRTDKRVLLLAALAAPIGAAGAFLAKVLLWLIALITNLAFFHRLSAGDALPAQHQLGFWVVFVPVLGALAIGFMARYGSEKIRGHGIPEALEAILLGRSLVQPKVAILKPLSSAISIGTGGPFGAEGPIIMTGGAFGSVFAQFFHLSAAERKVLLVAGAAAGMSAVFATPIAAILLAVELLLFEWKARSFIPVAVASIVAWLARIVILGSGAIFPVSPHLPPTGGMLATALLVGITSGFGSAGLTQLVYWVEDGFNKLPMHWMWWPAIGAVVVGLGGWADPRVLGVGYGSIHQLILGELTGSSLFSLVLLKALVWAVALGSGTSGGVLAPLLIMGGAIGAALGHAVPGADPGLCAMVGMASIMGGTMRSPLTGMIFLLELTKDLNALPMLLVGSVAAFCVTVLVMRRSILTEKLARRGQHIIREYSIDLFEWVRVKEVMDQDIPLIPAATAVSELARRIAQGDPAVSRRQGTLLVDDQQNLAGIVTRGDLLRALEDRVEDGKMTVLQAGTSNVIVCHPDEPLHDAVNRMLRNDIGRLPVVSREDPRKIVGYLGRASILAARNKRLEEEEIRQRGPIFEKLKKAF